MGSVVANFEIGDGPLVAAAIHAGPELRPEVARLMRLSNLDRLCEEDPYTDAWTSIAATRIIGRRSRFEVDLNRPRDKAVYVVPADAWGLKVWESQPPSELVQRSLEQYDAFYAELKRVLTRLVERCKVVVIYDLHSYNHRRAGPDAPPAPAETHPEVNVGTGTMDRGRWAPIVDRFIGDLRAFDFWGRHLDVRENVRFFGGNFPRWIHQEFPDSACVLAVEFKKIFMDEWTGRKDELQTDAIRRALESTVAGVREEALKLCGESNH